MKEQNEYLGVFDIKESDTFRPTLKSRMHLDSPVSKTLTCREDSCGVIERERERESRLRIRKLTPRECFRLMGFDDSAVDVLIENNFSDTQLFHLAGDSIVSVVISYLALGFMEDEEDAEKRILKFIDTLKEEKDD